MSPSTEHQQLLAAIQAVQAQVTANAAAIANLSTTVGVLAGQVDAVRGLLSETQLQVLQIRATL